MSQDGNSYGAKTFLADARSIMFLSPLSEKHLNKAPETGADAVILDLEDAIAPDQKPAARAALKGAVATLRGLGLKKILVRVNAPWLLAIEDIAAAVEAGVDCLTVPKVEGADRVSVIAQYLEELEEQRGGGNRTLMFLQIETALGVENLSTILRASDRVCGTMLGPEDFAKDMGHSPTIAANDWANIAVLNAARAAGVTPIGFPGSITIIRDMDLFRAQVERANELGFRGAAVVHPAQAAMANEVFSPSEAEIEEAKKIVAAADATTAGAYMVDGKMIDAPIVDRARATLARVR
ncbi:CoA ester lyase [Hwanghaeella grinnelliae]|uniref:CoA ester lyase n=1 Tax=Hwanghaeella grinnelliae TaxID=2500179 RepID=A0A3S2VT45_9PROT|nr:CoA ester lyase [Hwanghaeella grinnelliae]RVU39203.1 CoA ester lyase [Hwanghaeella grinnelliae]